MLIRADSSPSSPTNKSRYMRRLTCGSLIFAAALANEPTSAPTKICESALSGTSITIS
ncbi:MAG: hypothetical protein LBB23_04560 [Rickettsiales bacterium]|nr:hypothetical protein [Rickettsiales bacterium]